MKLSIIILSILVATSCTKEELKQPEDNSRTVKAWVSIASKSPTGGIAYYKPGITFDRPVKAKGIAVIKMTRPSVANPVYFTLHFSIGQVQGTDQSSYSEISDLVSLPGQAETVTMESFEITEGDYKITVIK
jgi:hypothetical protein